MKQKVRNMSSMLYLSAAFGMLYLLVSGTATAGTITGSAHDLSEFTDGQICVVCHTPHNSDTTETNAPLWNHAASTITTYTPYSSATLNATFADPNGLKQPQGISKLCLSCHDGSVAVDSYNVNKTVPNAGTTTIDAINADYNIGGDTQSLSDDHPVSIVYDSALVAADGALHPVTTAVTIGDTDTKDTTISGLLFSGSLECATCHDVHNKFTAASTSYTTTKLLRVTMNNSSLCLTCHNK